MDQSKPVDSELDQFDLLGPEQEDSQFASLPETNLAATTQAFNNRIQRKKKEQEKSLSAAEKSAAERHCFMIQALMQMRKSLRDVTRVDLGDRFHFSLAADDWQGWPRLTVKLVDTLLPESDYPFLRVIAHDRQSRGVIEIEYDASQGLESISLISENELKRMPGVVKKCVRAFLDLTGDIVLEAERKNESVASESEIQHHDLDGFGDEKSGEHPSLSGDLFQEDLPDDNFLETLPTIDSVEALPSAKPKK